jgi:hypothetical protein
MIAIPNQKPVISRLNSYYLNIEKMIEHFQGELGSGCIYFESMEARGAIYFDVDELLNGMFISKGKEIIGKRAIPAIVKAASTLNFLVDIFELNPDEIYLWANMATAKTIYKDLSAEFTDLHALVKKMESERLTGSIEVSIGDGRESGIIFLNSGMIIGGSCSWSQGDSWSPKQMMAAIIQKIKASTGLFNVNQIVPQPQTKEPVQKIKERKENLAVDPSISDALEMLEELLNQFESVVQKKKKLQGQFRTLLKKKFIQKADQYDFLDPFAAEFEYANGKVGFIGKASELELVHGVFESVGELAKEVGVYAILMEALIPWLKKYGKSLDKHGIHL